MFRLVVALTVSGWVLVGASAFANDFICGHDNESGGGGSGLLSVTQPRVRFVYVSFPLDPEPVPGDLAEDPHQAVLDTLKFYFAAHSRGSFTLSEDSDVILHQGESFQGSPSAWEADLPANLYQDPEGLPVDYEYADLESWWYTSDPAWATVVCAEILKKIQDEWQNVDSHYLDNTDYLIMIFLTDDNPFGPFNGTGPLVDGRAKIAVNASALDEFAFFDGLARDGSLIRGTAQRYLVENNAVFTAREAAKGIAHEMGHTLGAKDGPPNLGYEPSDLELYFYGNRNLMCQNLKSGEGIPPIGLGWLQDLDWRGDDQCPLVVDFAGENLIDLRLTDISLPGGRLYRFKPEFADLPQGAISDQYFLIAYHSQTSWIDTQGNDDGDFLARGPGLEIWHCIRQDIFDLESASGLFADPREIGSTEIPPGWQIQDSESGFDNHDMWPAIEINGHEYSARTRGDYGEYVGDEDDFFGLDEAAVEFNYLTNPSSDWYRDDSSQSILRRKPQDLLNMLGVDFLADNGDGTIQVDLLTGPYEEVSVTYPYPETPFLKHGDTLLIGWGYEHPVGLLTEVEIYFSADGGTTYEIITDNPVPFGNHVFPWVVPVTVEGTTQGRLKVVFFNQYSPLGGPFVFPDDSHADPQPDPIRIDEPILVTEELLTPIEGAELFAHTPVRVQWSDFYNDPAHGGVGPDYGVVVTSVDLDLLQGANWMEVAHGLAPDGVPGAGEYYHHDDYEGVNYYQWTPTNDQVTANGQLRLTLHYELNGVGQSSQTEGNSSFVVYPLTVKYEDRSAEAQLQRRQQGGYIGQPSCVTGMDYDNDDDIDFFLGMTAGQDSPFLNRNALGLFEKRPDSDVFPVNGPPPFGTTLAIHGDYDGDGYEDLFCGHLETPQLFHNGGPDQDYRFFDVTPQFPTEIQEALSGVATAAWVDWDHDGDLDLLLGRTELAGGGGGGGAPDVILINGGLFPDWRLVVVEPTETETRALAVLDFDQDGYLDVFVGVASGSQTLIHYSETAEGGFLRGNDRPPSGGSLPSLTGLAWVDINNDGWLDLVERSGEEPSVVLLNDQEGWFSAVVSLGKAKNLEFLDFNGDGWLDYFISGVDDDPGGKLWMNTGGRTGFPDGFVNVTQAVGIAGTGIHLNTVLNAPFSPDACPDLLSPRQDEGSRYFQAVDPADPLSDPQVSYVTVRLVRPDSSAYPAYGSIIQLHDSFDHSQWQHIEGGAGLGSQKPQAVSFGLVGFVGDISGLVTLPEGREISFSIPDSIPVEIPALSPAEINIGNIQVYSEVKPNSLRDLHFRWTTDLRCSNRQDRIILIDPPAGCALPDTLGLDEGLNNLAYDMSKRPDGKFDHEMVLTDIPCSLDCAFDYWIESGIGGVVTTSNVRTHSAKACGVTPPWDPNQG
jgi:hypothetical protein